MTGVLKQIKTTDFYNSKSLSEISKLHFEFSNVWSLMTTVADGEFNNI